MSDGANAKVIYNVYDAGGALSLIDKATENELIDYIAGPMGTLARISSELDPQTSTYGADDITYLHPDGCIFWFPKIARGSAQAGTKADGSIDWREQYTPFGEQIQNPAANDNLDGFTGYIKDKATGLNYMQARYYDPVIGRFLSIDPVTFTSSGNDPRFFNRYVYTFNDPINLVDPDGQNPAIDRRADDAAKAARVTFGVLGTFRKHNKHAKAATKSAHDAVAKGDIETAQTFTDTDKFEHFMANYESAEEYGEAGAGVAKTIGDIKEGLDKLLGKNTAEESSEDKRFNDAGLAASEEGLSESQAESRATEMVRERNENFIPPREHD